MRDWWESDGAEVYWCEITDRPDIGADLKCPQQDEQGRVHWSYDLIRSVWPGDIVYHYSTRDRAFVGASVAGGPLEERPILWVPHGTVGRANVSQRQPRPGWWLPLYGFRQATEPLPIATLHNPADETWIRAWISDKEQMPGVRRVAAPFQRYGGRLRASQGYLTKMPKDFVDRWPELTRMADTAAPTQDALTPLGSVAPPRDLSISDGHLPLDFKPKNDADYVANVQASVQRRTRNHERLVRQVGEWLRARGADVATPHPIDLYLGGSDAIVVEAKLVVSQGARAAIREAVGQLHEYRYFRELRNATLCVLLDDDPGSEHVTYVEDYLGLLLAWWSADGLVGGPKTAERLSGYGVRFAQSL